MTGPGRLSRVLLLGGTSEIGLAIVSALDLGPDTKVILAGLSRALRGSKSVVWVPAPLVGLATVMKLIPRPVWRTMKS